MKTNEQKTNIIIQTAILLGGCIVLFLIFLVSRNSSLRLVSPFDRGIVFIDAGGLIFGVIFLLMAIAFHSSEKRLLLLNSAKKAKYLLEEKNAQLEAEIAARRKMQEELLDNQRRYKALIDNIQDWVWMKDLNGRYLIVNEVFSSYIGIPVSEIVGKSAADVWPVQFEQKFSAHDAEVIKQGKPLMFVDLFRRKPENAGVWTESIRTPLRDKNGTIIGMVGISRIINERKEYEERVEALNRMFVGISPYFERNIQKFVDTCGVLLSADMVFYNRLRSGSLSFSTGWNVPDRFPQDLQRVLCEDFVLSGAEKSVKIVTDLASSAHCRRYPEMGALGVKAFMGYPLISPDGVIGVLCALYTHGAHPGEGDKRMFEIIAAAIGIEEQRRLVDEKLKAKIFDLERFNRFAVDRELKMIELKKKVAVLEGRSAE